MTASNVVPRHGFLLYAGMTIGRASNLAIKP